MVGLGWPEEEKGGVGVVGVVGFRVVEEDKGRVVGFRVVEEEKGGGGGV